MQWHACDTGGFNSWEMFTQQDKNVIPFFFFTKEERHIKDHFKKHINTWQ